MWAVVDKKTSKIVLTDFGFGNYFPAVFNSKKIAQNCKSFKRDYSKKLKIVKVLVVSQDKSTEFSVERF